MLPVWQEVPHHSMGPELNSTVRNDSTQNPELIYIVSHHLFVEDCAHTCTQSGRDKHLNMGLFGHAWLWANTHTHVYTHADVVMYPTIWVKGTVCSGFTHLQESKGLTRYFSHTFTLSHSMPLSLSVSLTHSLTISQCCYWNLCVCWCGLWNWWMTSHGRFIVRILVQLERKLMASWDYGGLRANTCLFHQETWGHFFTPSQIRATPPNPLHHHQHSYF